VFHKFSRLVVVLGAFSALAAPVAQADPPSKTLTTTVIVPGTAGPVSQGGTGFIDTGIILEPGQTATITATGVVDACGGACPAGPDGAAPPFFGVGPVIPIAPAGALVGEVGTAPWQVLGSGPTVVSGSGDLLLGTQDGYDWSDNSGSFTVTITQPCTPGNGFGDTSHLHCGPPGQNKA